MGGCLYIHYYAFYDLVAEIDPKTKYLVDFARWKDICGRLLSFRFHHYLGFSLMG